MRRFCLLVFFAAAWVILPAIAQQAAPAVASSSAALDAQQICAREFGDDFKLDPKFQPITTDLDGDGQQDLVLVATSKNPLGNAGEYHYRAIDPYDAYFGYGDPKVTIQFSATNAATSRYLLVVHNWRAPKAKFVVLNLPFDSISASRVTLRKNRSANAIHAVELGGLASDIYWNGKKYKWSPGYFDDDSPLAAVPPK